ncbi:MAG: SIMPL domain-containing protein [Aquirhabdus sp.]
MALTALLASNSTLAETQEHRIISLQAETSREVQNDQMQATLYTELNNSNPTVLAKESAQIINGAMNLAKAYSTVRVSNGTQSTYPIYNDKNKLTGWRGRAEIQLKTTDFKAGSELIAQLQSSMQLEAVNFSVSTEQRLKVENELLTEITTIFRKNAAQVQQAWGASKYELVNMTINNNSDQPRPYPMMMRAAKFGASDASVPAQTVQSGNSLIRTVANGSIQLQ